MKIFIFPVCTSFLFLFDKTFRLRKSACFNVQHNTRNKKALLWNVLQSSMLILPSGGDVTNYTRV